MYEGCHLYFRIREQKQVLIIENRFIIFQINPPLRSTHFCVRLHQLSKHSCHSHWCNSKTCTLNASIGSSDVEKRWSLVLCFTYGNKNKSFSAKSGLYGGWLIKSTFWVLKNAYIWTNCRSTFATLTDVVPKHALWMHQSVLQMSKNVDLLFNLIPTGITSHSVSSQDYMGDESSNRSFECSKMHAFEPMCESSNCRGEELSVFGD